MKQALRTLLAVIALSLIAAVTVVSASPSDAEAYCRGGTSLTLATFFGREEAQPGTCNGDGVYRGQVTDTHTDGYCVAAQVLPNTNYHNDNNIRITLGYSCSTSPVGYTYHGVQGTYGTESGGDIRICQVGGSPYYGTCSWSANHSGA